MGDKVMTLQEQARETIKSRNIDTSHLIDIETIGELDGSTEAKMTAFIKAIKNPYLFRVGSTTVHLEFSDQSSDTLQDKMCNILSKSIG